MDPVAFNLFGISIRWYGILISFGMILATLITMKRARDYDIHPDKILDIILFVIPVGIIGARIYYVLFNWEYYKGDLMKIINIRAGGLAIHGGLVAGIIMAIVLCSFWNVRFLKVLDLAMPGVVLAQAIGRWGNFFNQEAYGTPTDLPWAIVVNGQHVHPTFLYESVWNLGLFFFLLWFEKRRKYDGQIFLLYAMFYSLARFFIEGLRIDSLMLGPFRVAQLLSAAVFIISLVLLLINRRRMSKRIFK